MICSDCCVTLRSCVHRSLSLRRSLRYDLIAFRRAARSSSSSASAGSTWTTGRSRRALGAAASCAIVSPAISCSTCARTFQRHQSADCVRSRGDKGHGFSEQLAATERYDRPLHCSCVMFKITHTVTSRMKQSISKVASSVDQAARLAPMFTLSTSASVSSSSSSVSRVESMASVIICGNTAC